MTDITFLSGPELTNQLIHNREQTLSRIYARTFPMVLHYIKQHHGNVQDAKDIFQDALIILYEKAVEGKLILSSSVSTYLVGICKRMWLKQLRQQNRYMDLPDGDDFAEGWEEPEEERALPLREYVERLGEACKRILVSFYYFGQNMAQIATDNQYRNVHTASVQKYKCLERLRKSLQAANSFFQ